ncbi:MAG: type II CRISPR RNA-guided endonuclease Cas9 [Phycisphaerae bacterium]|nr:type II CRISPR RNA-guided endonuclease Cas9 [Phycisphaerae bacterium]
MRTLGLDIGSNSVGSAWVDTEAKTIKLGVSVFPAGVESSTDKRGEPKNQARRSQRQQRRSIKRRAELKRRLCQYLIKKGWMPTEKERLQKWKMLNPWFLRRDAVREELKTDNFFNACEKFGRILLHLAQRRGAWWFDEESEDIEDNKKKKKNPSQILGTVEYTKRIMEEKDAQTFGELIAIEYENRETITANQKRRNDRVRNRANAFGEKESEFVADRHIILAEFLKIWETQKRFEGELTKQLTDKVREEIYNPQKTDTWRCKGVLFSQRKAYWDLGTLGRCDLEPTDEKCPKADMYAQEFLVRTSVNNIRITPPAEPTRKLCDDERNRVIEAVRKQKTASERTIRKALKIDKGENKTLYTLNTDGDKFTVNGDWFSSQIVCDVFGEDVWGAFDNGIKESVNSAILKFDPNEEADKNKLGAGCKKWWGLDDEQTKNFIAIWEKRPKKDSRVNLSRKAIKNLLPYLRDGWSVTEARDMYAEDASNGIDDLTRKRYSTKDFAVSKQIRQFQEKHPDLLPPVSEGISNPVVRKSIHEVRRHLMEHIKRYGKPDRVVIELAREARQSEKVIAKKIQKNKAIEALKKEIIETHNLDAPDITSTQRESAIKRIRLCRQQRYVCAYSGLNDEKEKYACAYSGKPITEAQAADGSGFEIDHIVPRSRGGDNGMSNLVLCYSTANQGKKDGTPIDWLNEEDFGHLELRFKHLKGSEKAPSAITKDNVDMVDKTKWKNLHRRTPKEGFTEEQLRSCAYAATQTTDWINKVLYGNEDRSKRYVFASNGNYTGILRRDWGLFFGEDGDRSEKGRKLRGDHRHHAVDAAVIAMTSQQCLSKIKQSFVDFEEQKENKNVKPDWKTVEEPWEGFSEQISEEYKKLKVSHRAYSKRIAGYLHKDTIYGPAVIYERHQKDDEKTGIKKGDIKTDKDGNPVIKEGMYIKNISAIGIKQNHLRMPDDWDKLKKEYKNATTKQQRKAKRKDMLALEEVPPAKSGIVRDIELRDKIRDWLKDHDFEDMAQAKAYIKENGLVINGTPVRKVRLLWKLNEVAKIQRKQFNFEAGKTVANNKYKSLRIYQKQNNHHIEIREKKNKKGEVKWTGDVITNFDAAKRVRVKPPKLKPQGWAPPSAVNREETKDGKFVMSLSKGEVVHMRYAETQETNYFVVFKIDPSKAIHFTLHTDANPASSKNKSEKLREDISLVPDDLRKNVIFNENGIPEKVKISPLGQVKLLVND